jgi:hypothetical protein
MQNREADVPPSASPIPRSGLRIPYSGFVFQTSEARPNPRNFGITPASTFD